MDPLPGQQLADDFLDRAWPSTREDDTDWVTAGEAAQLVYPRLEVFRRLGEDAAKEWSREAVAEVDAKLRAIATSGTPVGALGLSPGAAFEVWRRLAYGITHLTLQDLARSEFRIAVPKNAPDDIRETTVLLWILDGIGRGYRSGTFAP